MSNKEIFYKFRNVDTNSLTSLANNQLWFDSLKNQNDPFEGLYIFSEEPSLKVIELANKHAEQYSSRFGQDKLYEMYSKITGVHYPQGMSNPDLLKLFIKQCAHRQIKIVHSSKICSFSYRDIEEDIDPIYENLMWSHYANGLRGFCLVFDSKKLLDAMSDSHSQKMRPIEVEYKDTPNTLCYEDFIEYSESKYNFISDNSTNKIVETISTKSKRWKYENEVRILSLDDSTQLHTYSPASLIEVVVGDKMPIEHQNVVINLAKANNPDVIIKMASIKQNSYQLEIIDYDSEEQK